MCSICGLAIANVVVSKLENKWLNKFVHTINKFIYTSLLYKRFIDDIFIVSDHKIDCSSFKEEFQNLNLYICEGDNDLDISLNKLLAKIET